MMQRHAHKTAADMGQIAAAAAAAALRPSHLLVCAAWALLHVAAAVTRQGPAWRGAALALSQRALALSHQPTRAAHRRGGAARAAGSARQRDSSALVGGTAGVRAALLLKQ
jgi:hypothetical protein